MSKRDDFQKTMEENLALGDERLEALQAHTRTAEHEKRIADLCSRREAAAAKLEQLKAVDGDKWDVVKHEMAKHWHDLDGYMAQAELAARTSLPA